MIFDNIKNCEKYTASDENFKKAFDFIKKAVSENYPVGRYEIDGSDLFAMVQEYTSRPLSECKYEGHRKYIDIQYIIDGRECIDVADITKADATTDFDTENDYAFFEVKDMESSCALCAGDFLLLYPHDIHRPGRAVSETPSPVKKIVVKVKA